MEKAESSNGDVKEVVKSLHEFSEKAGQFGFMEEGADGPKLGKGGADTGYSAVNYLLGFITFGLVIYFMILLRGNKGGGGGTGWGGSGNGAGGLFGKRNKGGPPAPKKGGFPSSGRGGGRR